MNDSKLNPTLTPEAIMTLPPCSDWPESRVRKFVPNEGLSLLEILRLDTIDVADRLWLALQPEVLPGNVVASFVEREVTRAIEAALTLYREPAFVVWAENWLSGEDRCRESAACAAADAAAADTAAAWAAADAAAWARAVTYESERRRQIGELIAVISGVTTEGA